MITMTATEGTAMTDVMCPDSPGIVTVGGDASPVTYLGIESI